MTDEPTVRIEGVEVSLDDAMKLRTDMLIYGNAFLRTRGDGTGERVDPARVAPDPHRTLGEVVPWLSWSCHVCGDVRPNDMIAVASTARTMGGVELTHNLRYCRDRESCRDEAERWRTSDNPLRRTFR